MKLFKFILAFWLRPISVFYFAYANAHASSQIQQIFVKAQTAAGSYAFATDPTDDTDAVPQYEMELPKPTGTNLTRKGTRRSQTPMPSRPGERKLPFSFKTDLVIYSSIAELEAAFGNSGVAITPLMALFLGCDLAAMMTEPGTNTTVDFSPSTNLGTLLSTFQVADNRVWKGIDCKSGFKLIAPAGELFRFEWAGDGRYYGNDEGFIEIDIDTSFYDAKVVELASNIQIIVGPSGATTTYDIDFANFELDWTPTIQQRKGHRGTNGLKDALFSERNPTFGLDPEMNSAYDLALINAWDDGTPVQIVYQTAASAPYFYLTLKGEIDKSEIKDDSGEARHDLNIRLASDDMDDELEMKWVVS